MEFLCVGRDADDDDLCEGPRGCSGAEYTL